MSTTPHRPHWFRDGKVFMSYADTCGINKDGNTLFSVDASTGKRSQTVDDQLLDDVEALLGGRSSATSRWVDDATIGAPRYYDTRHAAKLTELLKRPELASFEVRTLGSLIEDGLITHRPGHGSPSADRRSGDIPYIKVSDIRAGQINTNPSNMVTTGVAEGFWRGKESGLRPFDLVTPIRASKNIGEFAVLMPGQERSVFTKEVLILRATDLAAGDNFTLLWALTLKAVREQWRRITLMQTNREDVGLRYREIEIPWTDDADDARAVSSAFRDYYEGVDALRRSFNEHLSESDDHFVFLGDVPDGDSAGADEE